mgnify:FL=1
MRGPPDEYHDPSSLPKKCALIQPAPGDNHEGKQSIHHHHTGQSEDQKGDHIDDVLDQRRSLIAVSSVVLRLSPRQEH